MKRREITVPGTINSNGNLVMYMGEINEFFKLHKGSRIIAKFTVSNPGTSEALKGYYYNYVVPTFKHAIWESGERKDDEQTELFLRELSPIMHEKNADIDTCKYSTRLKEIKELSNAELIEHIDTLKQIAAEEYNVYIDDPHSI